MNSGASTPTPRSWLEVDLQCEKEDDEVGSILFSSHIDDVHENSRVDSVRGKISKCSAYWSNVLSASQFVQIIVEDGYKISFQSIPYSCFLADNKSALDHTEFV